MFPNNVLEGLEWGGEPEEGGGGAVGFLQVRILVGLITRLGSWLQVSLFLSQNFNF